MGKLFLIFLFFVLSCCCLEREAFASGKLEPLSLHQKPARRVHVRWFNDEETDALPGDPLTTSSGDASAREGGDDDGATGEQEATGEAQVKKSDASVGSGGGGGNEQTVSELDMLDFTKVLTEEHTGSQQQQQEQNQPTITTGPQVTQTIDQSLDTKLAEEVKKELVPTSTTTTTTNNEQKVSPAVSVVPEQVQLLQQQFFPEPSKEIAENRPRAEDTMITQEPPKPESVPQLQPSGTSNDTSIAQEVEEAVEVATGEEEKIADVVQVAAAGASTELDNKVPEVVVASEPMAPPAPTPTQPFPDLTAKALLEVSKAIKVIDVEAKKEVVTTTEVVSNNKVPEGQPMPSSDGISAKLEPNSVPLATVVAEPARAVAQVEELAKEEVEREEAPKAASQKSPTSGGDAVNLLASTVLLERLPNSIASSTKHVTEEGDLTMRYELDLDTCSNWLNTSLPQRILEMTVERILRRLGPKCQERVELKLQSVVNKRIRGHVMEASSSRLELKKLLGSSLGDNTNANVKPVRVKCHEWLKSADESSQVVSFVLKFLVEPNDHRVQSGWRHYTRFENLDDFPVEFPSERKLSNTGNNNNRRALRGAGSKCRSFKLDSGHFNLELMDLKEELVFKVELVRVSATAYGASEQLGGRIRLSEWRVLQLYLDHVLEFGGFKSSRQQKSPAASSTVQILHDHSSHHRRYNWLLDLYADWLEHEYRRQVGYLLAPGGPLQHNLNQQCLSDSIVV